MEGVGYCIYGHDSKKERDVAWMENEGVKALVAKLGGHIKEFLGGNAGLSRDQKLFVTSGCLSNCHSTLVTGVFMTGYALWLGASEFAAGLALSISMVANICQVFSSLLWDRIKEKKKTLKWLMFIARVLISSVILIPLLIPARWEIQVALLGVTKVRVAALLLILLAAYILGAGAGLNLNNWMVSTVSRVYRGTFFAIRSRLILMIGTLVYFFMSQVLDGFKAQHMEYAGFMVIFMLAFMVAVVDFHVIERIPYSLDREEQTCTSLRQLLILPLKNRRFMGVAAYLAFYIFSMNLANPYYNVYMLKYLKLPYSAVMVLTIIQYVVQLFAVKVWGRVSNRKPWISICKLATGALAFQFFLWPFTTPSTLFLLPGLFILAALIGSGLNMAVFYMPYSYAPEENKIVYLGFNSTVYALFGFLGSFTGGNIISSLEGVTVHMLGLEFGSMQINMGIASLVMLGSLLFGHFMVPTETIAEEKSEIKAAAGSAS